MLKLSFLSFFISCFSHFHFLLLLPEGRAGEAWESSNKVMFFPLLPRRRQRIKRRKKTTKSFHSEYPRTRLGFERGTCGMQVETGMFHCALSR
jgi:hypothetical protein